MLLNTSGIQTYLGPGAAPSQISGAFNGKSFASPVPITLGTTYNLKIALDFDAYNATFYINNIQVDQRDYLTSFPNVAGFTLTFRDPAPSTNPTSPRQSASFDNVIVDQIVFAAVPEPSVWVQLFFGVSLYAGVRRCFRRQKPVARN